jgi:8-oxo-dGTP pyrophosphatase MutT (NUDIX family)
VRRELYEETGFRVASQRLVDVHHVHIVEVGRHDQYEDYHGVHLLYAVEIERGGEPRVTEADSTTDLARWVPLDELPPRANDAAPGRLLPVVEHVLATLDHFLVVGGS